MAKKNTTPLWTHADRLLAETELISRTARNQLDVLKDRVQRNRQMMTRFQRQFEVPPQLWENLKP